MSIRFGVFTLASEYGHFPVYERSSSDQVLFYQKDYERWIYAHRMERWIVGSSVGESQVSESCSQGPFALAQLCSFILTHKW